MTQAEIKNRDRYDAESISLSAGVGFKAGEQFFEHLRTAQTMLNADAGTPILDSRGRPLLGTDGRPQTYFSATDAQRADSCGNTLLCDRSGRDVIANRHLRDEERLERLRAINGQAEPVYPAEELLLGGEVGKRLARTVGRAVGEEVVTADQAAANRLTDKATEETFALERIGQNNSSAASRLDNSVLNRGDQRLTNELAAAAKVRVDTSNDAFYISNTDRSVLTNNNFDMDHVLSGEINANQKATGYHAEFAANGQARITPGVPATQNANGTYEAPVQIWDEARKAWVDKVYRSTFFPPSWSEARITYEVTEAFKQGTSGTSFQAATPSGIRIQFRWDSKNQRTVFFPRKVASP